MGGNNASPFAEAVAQAQPDTRRVKLCLRGDLRAEIDRAGDELQRAVEDDQRLNRKAQAPKVAERIRELEAQAVEESVEFVFRGVGKTAWFDLIDAHPPLDEQVEAFKQRGDPPPDHNPDTFQYAALAASCSAPEGATPELFAQLAEKLTLTEWGRLWGACLAVNVKGAGDVPKSVLASAVLGVSETKHDSAETPESPGVSFLGAFRNQGDDPAAG